MLKRYEIGGLVFQFEEGRQPEGATEARDEEPKAKAKTPANKARSSRKKVTE